MSDIGVRRLSRATPPYPSGSSLTLYWIDTVPGPAAVGRRATPVPRQLGARLRPGFDAFVPAYRRVMVADDEIPDDLSEFFEADGGIPPRPFAVAVSFLFKALGVDDYSDLPLEDLVTAESLANWDLDEVAASIQGFGVATHTRYLSPSWALVVLPRAEKFKVFDQPETVEAWGLFVRFEEHLNDWRVHALTDPSTPVESLP